MRVNPNPWADYLAAMNRTQLDQQEAMMQLSTGRKVNQPSDNPAAAALLVGIQDQVTLSNRYLQNINTVQGQMQEADSTLGSIETALQRALSLGVQGANGTLSDTDREAIVSELQIIKSQLIYLGNTRYQGRFLFAGTVTDRPPFVADTSLPSGVRYDGNNGVNSVQIGDGFSIAVNKPGSQLFMSSDADMFQGIADLIAALQANSGYDAAIGEVTSAFNSISTQRVFYGSVMNQAESQTNALNSSKLQLASQENVLAGADLAATAIHLANNETSLNATMSAMAHYQQMNLFDYLR